MKSETAHSSKAGWFSISLAVALGALLSHRSALADTTIATTENGWEIFTSGRVNSFLNYYNGQGIPNDAQATAGSPGAGTTLHTIVGGGGVSAGNSRERDSGFVPTAAGICPQGYSCETNPQGHVEGFRVRSGFLANVFGFGVRRQLSPTTKFSAYIETWAQIESDGRRKYVPVFSDVRQGFIKIEGGWGSLLAGRALTLFSRGATVVDFLYAHQYGLGHPGDIEGKGPTAGHIGTGVMAAGFAAGFVYATPIMGGLQLSVGLYDPVALTGAWERTKYPRPEAELTFDRNLGSAAKLHLFANGGWQKFYAEGRFDTRAQDPTPEPAEILYNETAYGGSAGGRIEVGPVRLGGSYYEGKGIGLTYAFENSPANFDTTNDCSNDPSVTSTGGLCNGQPDDAKYALRRSRGFHVQGVLSLLGGKLDLSGGFSQSRLLLLASDTSVIDHDKDDQDNDGMQDADPTATATPRVNPHSNIKTSTGISALLIYHLSDSLHLALDYFHARYAWYLGESQLFHFASAGVTVVW